MYASGRPWRGKARGEGALVRASTEEPVEFGHELVLGRRKVPVRVPLRGDHAVEHLHGVVPELVVVAHAEVDDGSDQSS